MSLSKKDDRTEIAIDKFKEYFKNYKEQYTFIGGVACDIILGNLGEDFRATKDIDMVLIL